MDLKLPMVVVQRSARLVEAWLPGCPGIRGSGTSLAALRDDLALAVMLRFEQEPVAALGAYQLPPHLSLRHVKIATTAQDRDANRKFRLEGRIGVLVEKWPHDDFHVVTPTRLPEARFALGKLDDLDAAVTRRIAGWCLEHDLESLDKLHAEQRERLDILEVDADPPSILPRTPPPPPRARRARPDKKTGKPRQTPEELEEKRRQRRLQVKALRAVARNLSHGAADDTLEHAFGREALVRELVAELEGRDGSAIVLIGPSGAGKTALVHEVTRRLHANQRAAGGRRDVWRVDGNRFIAGMSYVGQWEARARELCTELTEIGDILYIDDLASMVYAGRAGRATSNVAEYLAPSIARGDLTVIAESTPERFEKVREEEPTFAALFRVVHVPPMTDRETLPVLLGALRELEGDGGADAGADAPRVSPAGLQVMLLAAERFLPHEAFPGKAVRLLARLCAGPGKLEHGRRSYDVGSVYDMLHRQTGLPYFILSGAKAHPRDAIVQDLAQMVAGQDAAVGAIADAVTIAQRAMQDPGKPLATYLFVGPTGVGKTETAKALARYLFGSAERLTRFDMSEFVSSSSISRLTGQVGAPDGELTTALRTQPFSVILFDEIEKAHPRVFDALLQLTGEGRLTDAAGRTADARQAVIIMTSNLGVREAVNQPGFARGDVGQAERHYVSAVRAFFRPEFFNRIDRVVPFRSLDRAALGLVVQHQLAELLGRRGIQSGNVLVDVETELLAMLVDQAFDPRYGARPLRRALERRLTVPLAHHLVRRTSNDLALVELYRRGDDMGLAVRLLCEAAALPMRTPAPADWTLNDLLLALDAVRTRLAALAESAEVARLRTLQEAALLGQGDPGVSVDLLERLGELAAELRELDEHELAVLQFVEEPDRISEIDIRRHGGDYRAARGGLRPRVGFRELPVESNPEQLLRSCRPRVLAMQDKLEVLAHQLRASSTPAEVRTVVVSGVGEGDSRALLNAVTLVPRALATRHRLLAELGPPGKLEWRDKWELRERPRRYAVVVHGVGLDALLDHLRGFAVLSAAGDFGQPRVPVRLEVLVGDGPEAIARHDAEAARTLAERRAGARPDVPEPGRVVALQRSPGTLEHLATGRDATEAVAIAAAMLRGTR